MECFPPSAFAFDIDFLFVVLISLNLARLGSVFEHKKKNNFFLFFPFGYKAQSENSYSHFSISANRKQLRETIFEILFFE